MIGSMKKKNLIAASVLAADFAHLGKELDSARTADWIHVDVMDGHFVPNISMGPMIVEAIHKSTPLPLDVHLMIETPEKYLANFAEVGASSLTVHVEVSPHLHQTIRSIKDLGMDAGAALNPVTPLSAVLEVLDELDIILIMSVNPGFGGQELIKSAITKVEQLNEILNQGTGKRPLIEVDGGINSGNIAEFANAGADVFVAGSSIFGHAKGISAGISELQGALLPILE